MRRVAVHFWPADQNAPAYAASTRAVEIGVGHHDQRVVAAELELDALAELRRLVAHPGPVATEPVNEIARTRGSRTSAAPTVEPRPVSTFRTPAGSSASANASATWRPVRGAS